MALRLNFDGTQCGNTRKSTHIPLWQTCKVLHPWVLFRETTVSIVVSILCETILIQSRVR